MDSTGQQPQSWLALVQVYFSTLAELSIELGLDDLLQLC